MNSLKSICAKWVHGMAESEWKFNDNTLKVLSALDDEAQAVLEELAGELESQVKRNTRIGQPGAPTKNSWQHKVTKDGNEHIAVVGSPLENAIWEEFGTGEHAITENGGRGGRKGAWYVPVEKVVGDHPPTYNGKVIIVHGKNQKAYYKTNGKKPSRAFWKAYTSQKNKIIRRIQNKIGGRLSGK